MKIKSVTPNNRRKALEIHTSSGVHMFPYALLRVQPEPENGIEEAFPDEDLGREGFTYRLADGREDTIHLDAVLEYDRDPSYLNDLLLHRLTVEARNAVEASDISKRELIRALGTSASQFYRLLDPSNRTKSVGQLIALLHVLGREVEVVVSQGSKRGGPAQPRRSARGKAAV
jgi:hypothetical protein